MRAGRVKSCGCYHASGTQAAKKADKVGGTSLGHIKKLTVFKNSRSGVRGVSWDIRAQKWRATIKFKGKQKYLGLFGRIEDAKAARREAEKELYGGFLKEMNKKKIFGLLNDALTYPDYDKRINFLLAGMLSAEANDTPEKEAVNMGYLRDVYKFCVDYAGDHEDYIKRTAGRIKNR